MARNSEVTSLLLDRGGTILAERGEPPAEARTDVLAALAAGSYAATREMAVRLGETEFNALYQQGQRRHVLMTAVDDDTILVTVFGAQTTVGLVRYYTARAAFELAGQLLRLRNTAPGVAGLFNETDLNAAAPFFDRAAS